jgi:hypothetical protein
VNQLEMVEVENGLANAEESYPDFLAWICFSVFNSSDIEKLRHGRRLNGSPLAAK